MSTALYWFRNDQRIDDNPALWQACQSHDQLLYCWIVDERWEKNYRSLSFPNMSEVRMQFYQQSVLDLARKLEAQGGKLIIRKGKPAQEVLKLAQENNIRQVYASKEPGYYERRQESKLSEKMDTHFIDSCSIFNPEELDLLLGDKSRSFTSFRKKVEKKLAPREILDNLSLRPSPKTLSVSEEWTEIKMDLPEKAAFSRPGGPGSASTRLQDYIWETKSLGTYKKTRNGLIGENYSSKFSPFLAIGNLSPIQIFHEVEAFEEKHYSNKSTYWMKFELLWREYFRWVERQKGTGLYLGTAYDEDTLQYKEAFFNEWSNGRTADDFVNANMHELNATGYMSNRGRQNAASYLVHNLKMPWQWGAAYFESKLKDYDVASNWGNWQYIAGLAPDGSPHQFDTEQQANRYDSKGKYRELWS